MENEYEYSHFMAALKHSVGSKWGGGQKRLHLDSGIGESMISQIMSGSKKAGLKNQIKIATVYGYKFEDFLDLGRSIIETGQPPPPKPATYPDTVGVVGSNPIVPTMQF